MESNNKRKNFSCFSLSLGGTLLPCTCTLLSVLYCHRIYIVIHHHLPLWHLTWRSGVTLASRTPVCSETQTLADLSVVASLWNCAPWKTSSRLQTRPHCVPDTGEKYKMVGVGHEKKIVTPNHLPYKINSISKVPGKLRVSCTSFLGDENSAWDRTEPITHHRYSIVLLAVLTLNET